MLLWLGVSLSACITEDAPAEEGDASGSSSNKDGTTSGADGGRDAQGPRPGSDASVAADANPSGTDALRPERDARTEPDPDDREALTAALCEHLDACFEEVCPPLHQREIVSGICEEISGETLATIRVVLELECKDVVELVFEGDSERAENFCSDDPLSPECQQVCGYLRACGVEDDRFCPGYCRGLEGESLECYLDAVDREDCGDFFECFEGDDEPDPEEVCGDLCERRWRCISRECAPGTVDGSYLETCWRSCTPRPTRRASATGARPAP